MRHNLVALSLVLVVAAVLTGGCQSSAQTGLVAGAGVGALMGQAIGRNTTGTLIGTAVGAAFSAVLFAISVVGLPLLLEREVDFVTAMIHSVQATLANLPVMIGWGGIITGALFLGMVPMFLGLFVVLPVLGHASWHMYRRIAATG